MLYVAGIAAGRRGWNGLSGMAPDASIIAVKVHSQLGSDLVALSNDIIAGMQALATNVTSGEVTANLSLGDPNMMYSSTCSGVFQAFEDAVTQLNSLRIPVVAASGNYAQRGYITWPSCVPRVIKVAATYDTRDQISGESDVINPTMVDAPMLFAPGCPITSSNIGGGTVSPACGTSAAAPHVAGLYAAIKAAAPGISVADASAWILANGVAVPVFWYGYSIKRINVPNL
ncbi:MAG: S8 family serine peptidase [Methylobacter sp.]